MTDRTRFVLLMVTAPILAYTLVGGLLGRVVAREGTYQHLRVFEDVVALVNNNYVEEVEAERVMEGALWGLAEGLDQQSVYLTEEEARSYGSADVPGEVGIGATLTRQYYVQIVATRDGSPAAAAGLRPGDFLQSIGDNPTRTMSTIRADQLLRGAPGSTVRVSVIRGNAAEPMAMEIVRSADRSANVTSRIVASDVGYVRIAEFDDTTADAVESAVDTLEGQGASKLVVDVRSTASGPFDAGIATAGRFTAAPTLIIRETTAGQQPVARTGAPPSIELPVVLLTNPGTSGAAEVFVAALTDADRADAVGLRTAGRAAEQTLIDLPGGGALLLSSTRYLTASGESIHPTGVEPAVAVPDPPTELGAAPPDPDEEQEDPVLDRALEHLTAMPTV
ncbi:MAG: S41 family peptidase [Acidobacteria bacterium]|nr:S41 family peptidase [Acidobacteriota bacterium]